MSKSTLCPVCEERFTSETLTVDDTAGNPVTFICCSHCRPGLSQSLDYQREELQGLLDTEPEKVSIFEMMRRRRMLDCES